MQTNQNQEPHEVLSEAYAYAANLMVNENKSGWEVIDLLKEKGLDEESATIMVNSLENEISDAKRKAANKDMLYGALWCVGGLVATMAHIGYIFWGAIVFGAIQFFRGLANSNG